MSLTLSDLPIDLLTLIVNSYLDYDDITALLSTSKLFHKIKLLNYSLKITEFNSFTFNSARYRKATNIEIVDFGVIERFPVIPSNLTELELFSLDIDYNEIYKNFIRKITTLTSLILVKINNILNLPSKLTSLKLYDCTGKFTKLPKSLKELEIKYKFYVDIDQYIIFNDNLEHLTLENKNSNYYPFLDNLPSKLKYLSCTNIYSPKKLPNKLEELFFFVDFPDPVDSEINLSENIRLFSLSNIFLPKELPEKLIELRLNGNINPSLTDLDILKNIKILVLDNIDVNLNTYVYFHRIFPYADKLEELTINDCDELTKGLIFPLSLKKLIITTRKDLNLSDLDNLEELNITNISKSFIKIELNLDNLNYLYLDGNFNIKESNLNIPKMKEIKHELKY